jgi:hypothetical protein
VNRDAEYHEEACLEDIDSFVRLVPYALGVSRWFDLWQAIGKHRETASLKECDQRADNYDQHQRIK